MVVVGSQAMKVIVLQMDSSPKGSPRATEDPGHTWLDTAVLFPIVVPNLRLCVDLQDAVLCLFTSIRPCDNPACLSRTFE